MKAALEKATRKIIKYTLIFVMSVLVLFAVMISLARFFMPSLDQYEQQITDLVAKELQLNVQFGTFAGDWYRFGPALKITDVVLSSHTGEVITQIDALYVSFNLLATLTKRQLVPAYLNVIGLNLDLEQKADNTVTIVHLPPQEAASGDRHFLLELLKKYNRITVRRSHINFKDAKGIDTPIYLRRMVLSRGGQSHQLEVMLNLLNHPTRLEIAAKINGDLAVPEKLAVNGYIEVDNAVLHSYLKPYAIKGYAAQDGAVDVHAWIDWQQNQLQSLQAEINLQQLQIYSQQQDVLSKPFDVQGAFLWKRNGPTDWTLSSDDMRLGIDNAELMPLVTKFKLNQTAQAYQFVAEKIIIDNVTQALLWSGQLPEKQQTLLTDLSLRGNLEDVKGNWSNSQDWQLGMRLNGLNYKGWNDIPGVVNLSAQIMATPKLAKVSLSAINTTIDYTPLFPEALLFSQIKGDILGQYDGTQWRVHSDNIVLTNDELQLNADFSLQGGDAIDPYINANVVIPQLSSLNLYHYLPEAELSTDLADWLKTSIGTGQLEQITIKTQGPAKDFPFYDEGGGASRLHMNLRDLNLTFDPDWPMLEQLSGQFLLSGRHIEISLDKAQIFQTPVLGLSADISMPKEGTSWLKVHGEMVTSVQHAVDFLNVTPLRQTIGKNLDLFVFNIPATLALDLNVPLDSETEETKVNGLVQISEGDATLTDWEVKFTDVQGLFDFTENNIHSEGIHAKLHGKPVLLTMTPQLKGTHHWTHWQLTGTAATSDIANYFPSSLWDYVKGESEFALSFEIDNDANDKGFDLSIASVLKGTEINLPAPLAKTKEASVPLRFTTSVNKPNTSLRLQYTKLIDAAAQFIPKDKKLTLSGAKVQLGGSLNNLDVQDGIVVQGSLPSFSYDVWEDFFDASNKQTSAEHKNPLYDDVLQKIKKVDVDIDKLEAFHYPLTKAHVNLTQAQNKWLINLNSNELKGKITIPQKADSGLLVFNFDYCNWNNAQHIEDKIPLDPRSIPALTFSCKDFVYDQKKLGAVRFQIEPESLGVKLRQVEMTRPNDTITAAGRWWIEGEKQNTRFTGHLDSQALDKTLELADIKSTILGSKTKVDFSLNWPGDPFDFALAQLNGQLDIHLSKGVLVDVNPGFGRILSLLSLQSLQRRLRLDFSDVFKKGFSFDEISALVTINKGIAHSDNLAMKAPAAEMKMKGDVNLATKQLNLSAVLTTHITSSLPLAATIASGGNPIVGAVGVGVWAVDKIVKSQAGDMLGTTYRVTGTWEKPIVNGK
jgi:uncharacterized protein (TIGR02099 family)